MKSFSFAKLLTLGCFALLLPVACGDDDEDGSPGPSGGSAGSGGEAPGVGGEAGGGAGGAGGAPAPASIPGTSTKSETIECGADDCSSTSTLLPTLFIKPCCTVGSAACGVDSGFLTLLGTDLDGACLPKDQPGELDSGCPDSPETAVPFNGQMIGVEGFKGCCRPNNTCGFLVNDISTDLGDFTSPGLGCVDSSAFGVPGGECGEGAGGAGGGGAGGAGGAAGGAAEGGNPTALGGAGAGGAP